MQEPEVLSKDIEKYEQRHPATIPAPGPAVASPMDAVIIAMEKGYSPEFIEKMMDLRDRDDAKTAKKAYVKAMAAFRNEPIFISKDLENKQYGSWYTSKGNLINTVAPILGKYGFSHRFDFKSDKVITVTCILTHEEGHSESVSIPGPLDDSGKKNPLQQIKSTKTYLEIATFESVTGLASQDGAMDDDGNSAGAPKPEPKKELVPEAKTNWANAVTAYRRDKNFKSIEKHVYISPANKRKIIADSKDVKVGEPA